MINKQRRNNGGTSMSDHISVSGSVTGVLQAYAKMAQGLNEEFGVLAEDCENANGSGGCLINTADGCLILGCPLTKGE